MKNKKKVQLHKKWWLWASIGVIILSIITGEGSGIGIRMSKEAALEEAEDCLRYGAYSYEGLIEELTEYRGFTEDAAVYAADNCGADWKEQAKKAAEDYGDGFFSDKSALKKFLQREGFTDEQIRYSLS